MAHTARKAPSALPPFVSLCPEVPSAALATKGSVDHLHDKVSYDALLLMFTAPVPSDVVPAPELGYEYDPQVLEAYWACRPIAVAKRASQVGGL